MLSKQLLAAALAASITTAAGADIIHVPGDHATIQQAIGAASPGDEIIVAPGTYTELISFLGRDVWVHAEGTEKPIINGSALSGSIVSFTNGEGPQAILEGFRIQNGTADEGAGIRIDGASPTIIDCEIVFSDGVDGGGAWIGGGSTAVLQECQFMSNTAFSRGGGVMVVASSPELTQCLFQSNLAQRGAGLASEGASPIVTACTFEQNNANTGIRHGGGAANLQGGAPQYIDCVFHANTALRGGGMINETCSPTLIGCMFDDNQAPGGRGGAMYNVGDPSPGDGQSNPLITECEFIGNDGEWGGGVATDAWDAGGGNYGPGSDPTFTDCQFIANVAIRGGALWADQFSDTTLEGCTFLANSATWGGASYAETASHGMFTTCVFIGNGWSAGGAVHERVNSGGAYYDCTFIGNQVNDVGGALYAWNSLPYVVGCSFESNVAARGGASFAEGSMSAPAFLECSFSDNIATHGGALYFIDAGGVVDDCSFDANRAWDDGDAIHVVRGSSATGYAVDVIGSSFTGNWASDWGGGFFAYESISTVDGCTFVANDGREGGGAAFYGGSNGALTNSTFDGNSAWDNGGGVYAYVSAPLVQGNVFVDNWAEVHGGGMICYNGSPLVLECTFDGNVSLNHGGGFVAHTNAAPLVLNSVFTDNLALILGGGVYEFQSGPSLMNVLLDGNVADQGGGLMANQGAVTIDNSTFVRNTAWSLGQGIYGYATVDVSNSILWDEDFGDEIVVGGGTTVVNYSIVRGGWPETNLDVEPIFVDAAAGDFRLAPGSPGIDAGNNLLVPLDSGDLDEDGDTEEVCPHDLDGLARLVDSPATPDSGVGDPPIVDMGAYEFQAACPTDTNGDGVTDVQDLVNVIVAWGTDDAMADVDGSGIVDVQDLVAIIVGWGPCG